MLYQPFETRAYWHHRNRHDQSIGRMVQPVQGKAPANALDDYMRTHWIDVDCMRSDDFDNHIINRAKILLSSIEKAIGKTISGKDSEETIEAFGASLKTNIQ